MSKEAEKGEKMEENWEAQKEEKTEEVQGNSDIEDEAYSCSTACLWARRTVLGLWGGAGRTSGSSLPCTLRVPVRHSTSCRRWIDDSPHSRVRNGAQISAPPQGPMMR